MSVLARMLGRIRLFRGRCPSCDSETGAAICRTCFGYEGPFPPSEATRTRWAGRFAQTAYETAGAPAAQPAVGELFPAR
jgi:hypothetical protein